MKSDNREGLPSDVNPIVAGSFDTLLSAARANEVIDLFNALDSMRAELPLFIVKSDANIVFGIQKKDPITKEYGADRTS